MKQARLPLVLAAGLLAAWLLVQRRAPHEADTPVAPAVADATAERLADDRATREVTGSGTVIRLLRDDGNGSRHQRILLRLPSGGTLLIAHNLDLAPRVEPLHVGDRLDFHGEYVWNDKGGVVHWTHRDPGGRHEAGWLRREGRTFQ